MAECPNDRGETFGGERMTMLERTKLPGYVAARIRLPPPRGCSVLRESTPVVSFGDPSAARVATVGLNPSRVEFRDKGRELDGPLRRFETLRSLGIRTMEEASDDAVNRVWTRCRDYFQPEGNPYWRWFRPLETLLGELGVSYLDGTAAHLDLSQWATDPTWSGLSSSVRARLLSDDAGFLRQQLEHEPIRLVLLNGRGVLNGFQSAFGLVLRPERTTVRDRTVTARLYTGSLGKVQVIAWSTNLQGAHGITTRFKQKLARRVLTISGR